MSFRHAAAALRPRLRVLLAARGEAYSSLEEKLRGGGCTQKLHAQAARTGCAHRLSVGNDSHRTQPVGFNVVRHHHSHGHRTAPGSGRETRPRHTPPRVGNQHVLRRSPPHSTRHGHRTSVIA